VKLRRFLLKLRVASHALQTSGEALWHLADPAEAERRTLPQDRLISRSYARAEALA